MRRRTSLSFALISGIVSLLGMAPNLVAAQETDQQSPFSDGITVALEETAIAEGQEATAIIATLEPQSYTPERTTPENEAMVVKVLKGTFAFRVQSPDVIVDAHENEIQLITSESEIGFGESPVPATPDIDPDVRFNPGGPMPTSSCSQTALSVCALDPAIFTDLVTFVVLEPGYTVFLPAGSTCFFCNVTPTAMEDQTGQLLYWVSAAGFNEYAGEDLVLSPGADASVVLEQGLHNVRGWMFNPGSPCH